MVNHVPLPILLGYDTYPRSLEVLKWWSTAWASRACVAKGNPLVDGLEQPGDPGLVGMMC